MSTVKLISKFLREMNSTNVKTAFESLDTLMEFIETKNDPDPVEMRLFEQINESMEQLRVLEGMLKNYVNQKRMLPGDKLSSLYERYDKSFE